MPTILRPAEDVVNDAPFLFVVRQLFLIHEAEIFYPLFAREEFVEKVHQQILVDFLAEDALEAHIGERINKMKGFVRLDAVHRDSRWVCARFFHWRVRLIRFLTQGTLPKQANRL